mmetsp:Transcript_10989/g.15837  ORF Transcript_10989/g.15837 Transcript_10989/m.15837 type:complete len:400 (-) Transcript_10989:1642-2841(-)
MKFFTSILLAGLALLNDVVSMEQEDDAGMVGLTPSEVLELQSSEAENELTSLLHTSDPTAELFSAETPKIWITQTASHWNIIKQDSKEDGCEYKKYNSATLIANQLFPMLICNKTPGMSGNERRHILDDLIAVSEEDTSNEMMMTNMPDGELITPMVHATPNIFIRGLVSSAKVLYNGDDQTCWIMTATSCLAMKLKTDAIGSNGELIKVQPLLPMMKIRTGTVDAVSTALSSKQRMLKISFELSPSAVEFDSMKFSINQWILGSNGRDSQTTQKELKDAFPYTFLALQSQDGFLKDTDPISSIWPHVAPMNLRTQLLLQIDLNALSPGGQYSAFAAPYKTGDTSENEAAVDTAVYDQMKLSILEIIAAVVSKGEIMSAEVVPEVGHRGLLRGSSLVNI